MGAGESIESNLWSSTFEMESKNSKVGIIRLTDKQTEDAYICRKISTLDKKQIEEMERLIDLKLSIQSPYVTKLQRAETEKHQEYCAYGRNFYVLFKQPYQTLKQQTLNRKFKSSLYSQIELQVMLETGVKALSFLRNIDHPHENISSTAFFVNENRSIILGDPWMFPKEITPKLMRNGFIYPSPESIKFQNNEITTYNPHLSDLFTFGLVLLEVFYMTNMDCVYERYFDQVNYDAIWSKLNPIKNQQLRKKLFILLDPEPKNREMVFKYYLRPISSVEVFNKISKEKFKRNIDRYNLTTSEVTEWKNDLVLEPRLNSSDGKKTFSVSTAENMINEQKGYNYYEREYGQNHLVNSKPVERSQGLNYPNTFDKSVNNQNNQFGRYNTQYSQPPQQQIFRTGSSQVKFINSNAYNNAHQRIETPSNHSNFSFPTIQQVSPFLPSSYKTSELPTLPQSYRLDSNLQHYSTPNFQFLPEKTQPSYTPTYSSSFSSQIKIPSPIIYRHSSNDVMKNYPLLTSASSSLNNISSASSQIIYKHQESVTQNGNELLINYSQEPSQTSIVLQRQPAVQEKKETIIEEVRKESVKEISVTIIEEKPETETPPKPRHKRNLSDYGKFQHLTTINQRSEMTESFISENDDKRSEILIEENEPNSQNERQNLSEEQNYHPIPQENKIWSIVYPSGTKYIGQIKNDKRNGLGTFFYIDGSKYHGHWFENKMNGFGTLFYPNGKIAYEGEWKMDNFHGKGKVYNDEISKFQGLYHYEDCTDIDSVWLEYDGELFEDRKEGKGILKLVNDQYFEGNFLNDELHGLCKFYSINSKVIEGIWENSKLMKVISQKSNVSTRVSQQDKL